MGKSQGISYPCKKVSNGGMVVFRLQRGQNP
jgi:hypothetical protein